MPDPETPRVLWSKFARWLCLASAGLSLVAATFADDPMQVIARSVLAIAWIVASRAY